MSNPLAVQSSDRRKVGLPSDLQKWAKEQLHCDLELHLSPVALGLILRPVDSLVLIPPYPDVTWQDGWRFNLAHLATTIVRISSFAVTKWPLLMIVDLAGLNDEVKEPVRSECLKMTNDPTWHHGDWSLYITPVVAQESTDSALTTWNGATTAEELVDDLLRGTVVDPSELPEIKVVRLADIKARLKDKGPLAIELAQAIDGTDSSKRLSAIQRLGEGRLTPASPAKKRTEG